MKWSRVWTCLPGRPLFACAIVIVAEALVVSAQNPELQQKVAEVKEAMAANKQALAQYTWQEQVTVRRVALPKPMICCHERAGRVGHPESMICCNERGAPSKLCLGGMVLHGGPEVRHPVEKILHPALQKNTCLERIMESACQTRTTTPRWIRLMRDMRDPQEPAENSMTNHQS